MAWINISLETQDLANELVDDAVFSEILGCVFNQFKDDALDRWAKRVAESDCIATATVVSKLHDAFFKQERAQ